MMHTAGLLPPPWRLLFKSQTELATNSALYQELAGYAVEPFRQMSLDAQETWHVDQGKGQFTCTKDGQAHLVADIQFLGTHDGNGFMWADSNPSMTPALCGLAKRTRDALASDLPQVTQEECPNIARRDGGVLLSFGGALVNADMTFQAETDGTVVYLALTNLRRADPVRKWPLLGRLAGRKKEPEFSLTSLIGAMDSQWQRHLLPAETLVALEAELVAADKQFRAGNTDECAATIARVIERMGPYANDQEPTGWVFFCDALCALQKGETDRAEHALRISGRALFPPEMALRLLAGARIGNWSESRLVGAYISNPDRFIELADDAEKELVLTAIQTEAAARSGVADNPVAVLKAANLARYEAACRAWEVAEAASEQRADAHVLCEADEEAQEQNNAEYRRLLLRWFAVGRNPSPLSNSNSPDEDPDTCEDMVLEKEDGDRASILATYGVDYAPDIKNRYRYVMVRRSDPLSGTLFWRIAEIWSVWDHEDIRLY